MRICLVSHYSRPHLGGTETLVYEESLRLAEMGHEVVIVTSSTDGTRCSTRANGVLIERTPVANLLETRLGVPYPILHLPSAYPVFFRAISSCDVCLIYGFGYMSSLLAAWICKRTNRPYVLYQLNAPVPFRSKILQELQVANDALAGRYVTQHAVHVLAISNAVRHYINKVSSRDSELLYGAVDHHKFNCLEEKKVSRAKLDLAYDKFIVLSVRRLVEKNGLDVLLDVAGNFRQIPQVLFVIVGDGPKGDDLRRRIDSEKLANCLMTGAVTADKLVTYYQSADVFMLTSWSEGLCLAVLEAMSCGIPPIVSGNGGQSEVVEHGVTGFVMSHNSAQYFCKSISKCVTATEEMHDMGSKCRSKVISQFTWDLHMSQLVTRLREVTERT